MALKRFSYVCQDCGKEYPGTGIMYVCPDCAEQTAEGEFARGRLLIAYDPADLQEAADTARSQDRMVSSFDLFPYDIPEPAVYPAGNTPLAASPRLAEAYGLKNLRFKLEGGNPSGSFKDRASQLVAAQAVSTGERQIVLASTGNAGSAMACAGAAYGLDVILFVPETAPRNKLMQSILYGAAVVPIRGSYDQAFALSTAYTDRFGGISRNTAYNPMTLEGKKSAAVELYRQYGGNVPDIIYIPVGDGVIYSGMHKGFKDLLAAGVIDRLPKLICCQSSGSDAVSRAWRSKQPENLQSVHTAADSISVGSPAAGRYAVQAINENGGWAVTVSDEEIFSAQRELAAESGIFAEPAAAASWAALKADREKLLDCLGEDAHIAVLVTGIGFKDMDAFSDVPVPDSIEPSIEAVTRFFSVS